jgi:hypothetical protein
MGPGHSRAVNRRTVKAIATFLANDLFGDQWCYADDDLARVARNLEPELIAARELDWWARARDVDPAASGRYTIDPEVVALASDRISLATAEVALVGESLADVARAVHTTYGATYWIPGIETWRHVYRHAADIPELRDTTHSYFYFGSLLRDRTGAWRVPASYWEARSLNSKLLTDAWGANDRALLLCGRR